MSSLQTLEQLETLRDLILQRATTAMDRSFKIGGVYATQAEKLECEFETGKYAAYKVAGNQLEKLINELKTAQVEEAAA